MFCRFSRLSQFLKENVNYHLSDFIIKSLVRRYSKNRDSIFNCDHRLRLDLIRKIAIWSVEITIIAEVALYNSRLTWTQLLRDLRPFERSNTLVLCYRMCSTQQHFACERHSRTRDRRFELWRRLYSFFRIYLMLHKTHSGLMIHDLISHGP